MALIITPVIGKRDLHDRVLVSRMTDGEATEELRRRQAGAAVVTLRLRPELNVPKWRSLCGTKVREIIASKMDDLSEQGEVSFTTRRRFDPEENRTVVDEAVTLRFGEQVTVSAQSATVLLDHPIYGYLLEEVESAQSVRRINKRGSMSAGELALAAGDAALESHKVMAAKDQEIARLKAQLAALEGAKAPDEAEVSQAEDEAEIEAEIEAEADEAYLRRTAAASAAPPPPKAARKPRIGGPAE